MKTTSATSRRFFAVQGAHKQLAIRAQSTVAVTGPTLPRPGETPPWEAAADRAALPFDAVEFVFDSTESRSAWTVEPTRAHRFRLAGRCSTPFSS